MSPVVDLFDRYRRRVSLWLGTLWIAFVVTFPFTAYVRGMAMGCFDTITGTPKLLVIGMPLVGSDFGRIIKQRYGVQLRLLGCVTDGMQEAYVDGYDRVIVAAVKLKYGISLSAARGQTHHSRDIPARSKLSLHT